MTSLSTFLMFAGDQFGKAEEAITFYVSLFTDASVDQIEYAGEADERRVHVARFTIHGLRLMASDAPGEHPFGFTPAVSLFVDCDSAEEQQAVVAKLLEGGTALMPLDDYGFSQRFAWVQDRYGVSWQLNLP